MFTQIDFFKKNRRTDGCVHLLTIHRFCPQHPPYPGAKREYKEKGEKLCGLGLGKPIHAIPFQPFDLKSASITTNILICLKHSGEQAMVLILSFYFSIHNIYSKDELNVFEKGLLCSLQFNITF